MNELRSYLTGKNLYNMFLHLVVVVLVVEVVILARQNREFKQGPSSAQQESLKTGDYFSLAGIVPLNSGARLDTTSARQLIFVFSTGCHFCRETLPLWKKIVDEVKTGWRVAPRRAKSRFSRFLYGRQRLVAEKEQAPKGPGNDHQNNERSCRKNLEGASLGGSISRGGDSHLGYHN